MQAVVMQCGTTARHATKNVMARFAGALNARPSIRPFTAINKPTNNLQFSTRELNVSASAAEADAPAAPPADAADVTKLDIRVGKILSVEPHPDAESLYVETIDLGEEEGPRTIVSGLKKYVELEDLQGRSVLVLANLKARNMRGIKSNGMLLCASNDEHTVVEPLSPPEGAAIGERVYFGEDGASQGDAANPNQLQKKKFWEACQPKLKTSADKIAQFEGKSMLTSGGAVTAANLANASIS